MRWLAQRPTLSVALMIIGVIALLLGPVLWAVGGWTLIRGTTTRALAVFYNISDPDKTVEAYGKLIGAVGLLVAAPVGLLGVGLAFWRTWNQHRDGVLAARKLEAEAYAKAAEAFAKAVEHLGSEKPSIRMGAVLALEALGISSPRLLSQAIEILCAFVRESRPVPDVFPDPDKDINFASRAIRLPTDIQLIVEIVIRLKRRDAANLIVVDFSGTSLSLANLEKAKLIGAKLNRTNLFGANLTRATLIRANLVGADLERSELDRANLDGACLIEAGLDGADLSGTSLIGASLIGASLVGANLRGAKLCGANLGGADLSTADLSGADLSGVKLTRATLTGANLGGADLSRADLSGVKLTGAKLTGAKLFETTFLKATLPDGRLWAGKGFPPTKRLVLVAPTLSSK